MKVLLRIFLFSSMTVLFHSMVTQAAAASNHSPISKKYQVMAGYLLHLTSYTRWPDTNAKNNINICIIGTDPFGGFIDEMLKARPLNKAGMLVAAKRINVGAGLNDCHVAFVSRNNINTEFWRSAAGRQSLLLVSDDPDFTKQGGIVSFYEENRRLRIEINLAESKKSGLTISSDLLNIARITEE